MRNHGLIPGKDSKFISLLELLDPNTLHCMGNGDFLWGSSRVDQHSGVSSVKIR